MRRYDDRTSGTDMPFESRDRGEAPESMRMHDIESAPDENLGHLQRNGEAWQGQRPANGRVVGKGRFGRIVPDEFDINAGSLRQLPPKWK